MSPIPDTEAGVCAMCFYELQLVKPWCRFMCGLMALTRGAICSLISVVILFSIPLSDSFPMFDILLPRILKFEYSKEMFYAYLLVSNVLVSVPYVWLASIGTKSCALLIVCICFSIFSIFESTTLLILALLDGIYKLVQWISILTIDLLTIASLVVLVLTLKTRQKERSALHSALLITNKSKDQPLLVSTV